MAQTSVGSAVIECSHVSMNFGSKHALTDVDLSASSGELLGLIGPDGAGKSTLLMIMAGLLQPTSGTVKILGRPAREMKSGIGVVTQDFSLYPELTAYENMRYIARLHGLDWSVFERRGYELLRRFGLYEARYRRAGQLSGGMKEKLAVCCAMIPAPRLLLLDEPTTGVDPISRRELWRLLTSVVHEGITAIVAIEHFDEGEACHRVAMLNEGQIIEIGKPRKLREEAGLSRLAEIFAMAAGHQPAQPQEVLRHSVVSEAVAISARDLRKRFGDLEAVKGLNLEIRFGEIYGLLGANGAGKTTTIQMLCGLTRPTSGVATIGGEMSNMRTKAMRRKVGYMNQKFALYDELTVQENLEFYCSAYGLEGDEQKECIDRAMRWGNLGSHRHAKAADLPRGWKQRVAFVASAMHQPQVIFLDEPTAGSDPWGRESLWSVMRELASDGTAILVTTHLLDEAEYCHRLGILVDGELVAEGTSEQLKQRSQFKVFEIVVDRPAAVAKAFYVNYPSWSVDVLADRIRLLVPKEEPEENITAILVKWGFADARIAPTTGSLEEAFIAAATGKIR